MFIVKITNVGGDYYLRNTTWTFSIERASTFEIAESAQQALLRAKKFTKPSMFKLARIVEFEEGTL